MTVRPKLDYLFHPCSVAIAGASENPASKGYDYLHGYQELGFPGALYPVNPNRHTILGLRAYPSVGEIPGTVDFIISCVPAEASLSLVGEGATKGAKAMQLFTAGFSETGEKAGLRLERELVSRALKAGMRVIGPNCIGLHYPKGGMAFGQARFTRAGGPVGGLIQSGAYAWHLVSSGSLRGLGFSKVISFGDASDLNEADFLEYLAQDPETRVIALYIEGVRDGPRFHQALVAAAATKPTIVFKGGRTPAGSRATSSHTGSLAGEENIWNSLFRQTGAIRVFSMEEMIDTILPFVYFPPVNGRRLAVVGGSGGLSVEAADELESCGLSLPAFPPSFIQELKGFIPVVGSGLKNPVDTADMWKPESLKRTLELVARWEGADMLIVHALVEMTAQWQGQSVLEGVVDALIAAQRAAKPMAVVLHSYGTIKGFTLLHEVRRKFTTAGVPVYTSFARVATALSRFVDYHARRRGSGYPD